ncbi:MAG: hypothetical protein GYB50_25870 [Rhodobacteraceae bacterium]|nr:hypothetical protein [Paracoccaceae bacterium]
MRLWPACRHRDLLLTADHALILGGLAINAGGLVTGGTIARETLVRLPEMVTCCHVETEAHEAVRANAALADTCLDHRPRSTFGNDDAQLAFCGEDHVIPGMGRLRISSARLVPQHIRARLALHEAARASIASAWSGAGATDVFRVRRSGPSQGARARSNGASHGRKRPEKPPQNALKVSVVRVRSIPATSARFSLM